MPLWWEVLQALLSLLQIPCAWKKQGSETSSPGRGSRAGSPLSLFQGCLSLSLENVMWVPVWLFGRMRASLCDITHPVNSEETDILVISVFWHCVAPTSGWLDLLLFTLGFGLGSCWACGYVFQLTSSAGAAATTRQSMRLLSIRW